MRLSFALRLSFGLRTHPLPMTPVGNTTEFCNETQAHEDILHMLHTMSGHLTLSLLTLPQHLISALAPWRTPEPRRQRLPWRPRQRLPLLTLDQVDLDVRLC